MNNNFTIKKYILFFCEHNLEGKENLISFAKCFVE